MGFGAFCFTKSAPKPTLDPLLGHFQPMTKNPFLTHLLVPNQLFHDFGPDGPPTHNKLWILAIGYAVFEKHCLWSGTEQTFDIFSRCWRQVSEATDNVMKVGHECRCAIRRWRSRCAMVKNEVYEVSLLDRHS